MVSLSGRYYLAGFRERFTISQCFFYPALMFGLTCPQFPLNFLQLAQQNSQNLATVATDTGLTKLPNCHALSFRLSRYIYRFPTVPISPTPPPPPQEWEQLISKRRNLHKEKE
jgi:hypothetical protein